ncbi:hypothetical protein LZ318_20400 [Saccharopolyspora indica]|uniref:hypothetical protein n=1 Tax=Saccharopolyspora indica TaxID=1229659 RepID=UPI0022EB4A16|nr:hypothetical protein [Saccharopolyspora indica]MDA3643252.1 hypothetical protein [Saccharopolyspora indica]
MPAVSAEPETPGDVVIEWRIPSTPRGVGGVLKRFIGPGRTRLENVVEAVGQLLNMALLALCIAWFGGWGGAVLPDVVLAVMVFDLVGGVLTNATNAAKRWYHRPAPGMRGKRLLFIASHLLYLVAVVFVLDAGGWRWLLINAALLLAAAVLVEVAPLEVKRLAAVGLYLAAVLVNLTWLPLPAVLAWFPVLFFLKLLVCFMVPEAPMYRRATA